MTLRDRLNKVRGPMHCAMYRLSRGRLGGRYGKAPILLLTTTGRRSGAQRSVPLIYVPDGERFVVVASNAGQDHMPAWFLNTQAKPEVLVEVRDRRMYATTRVASEEERAVLWPKAVELFKGYTVYAAKTKRTIPLVVVDPK